MTTLHAGEEGFIWFFGVVEAVDDPLQVGRVRVRIHRHHNPDKGALPVDALPWASVMQPIQSAADKGIGWSPTGINVGTVVVGFFMDGNEKQLPMVLGTIAGVPEENDVNKLALGTNTIDKSPVGPEPASPYKAVYPFNKTLTTSSGHAIEIDDTAGGERIHFYHKDGAYIELQPEGVVVVKSTGKRVDVSLKDHEVYVRGVANITVDGNININTKGTLNISASKVNIGCDVIVDGDVVASGISLTKHKHGGVDTGPGKTSGPE